MTDYEVGIVTATASPTAVSRGVATSWEDFASRWRPMLDGVWAFVRRSNLRTDGHNIMVYRNQVPSLEFEVGVEVARSFEPEGPVVPSSLPSGAAAHAVHIGDYAGLGGAYDAIARWCRTNGRPGGDTRWEVYGDWTEDPNRLRTDVYWLLQS